MWESTSNGESRYPLVKKLKSIELKSESITEKTILKGRT